MIVSEEVAKKFLNRYGLVTPMGAAAATPEEAARIAGELGGKVVVKALIPIGGRGKAGGVKVCQSPQEVKDFSASLLGKPLLGHLVTRVLVEKAVDIAREMYASVVVNTTTAKIDMMVSFLGGMEIENTAHQDAEAVRRLTVEPGEVLPVYQVQKWLGEQGSEELAYVLTALYRAAADLDANLLEINPLAKTADGAFVLLDCKLDVDENGLSRQPQLKAIYEAGLNRLEKRARELALSFVPLDGHIGVLTSGAGLGMMTVDMLRDNGLEASNFLDTGGGISENQVKGALELLLDHEDVRGVIINLYGGINRMLEAAKGIEAALPANTKHSPIVVKVLGNQQEEAWSLLEKLPDVHVIKVVQTETAVDKLAELVR
jgi:succinyl-CoA synthetase beta subunit